MFCYQLTRQCDSELKLPQCNKNERLPCLLLVSLMIRVSSRRYVHYVPPCSLLEWIPFETQNFSKYTPTSNLGHKPKAKLQGFCRAEAPQNKFLGFIGSALALKNSAVSCIPKSI